MPDMSRFLSSPTATDPPRFALLRLLDLLSTDTYRLIPNRRGFIVASLFISALATSYYWRFSVVVTDDALIYFRLARHVLQGSGPVFNVGDAEGGGTSLVWIYVLAAGKSLFPSLDLAHLSLVLASVCTFGASWLLVLTLRECIGDLSLLSPVALISIDLFRRLPGLEIPRSVFGGPGPVELLLAPLTGLRWRLAWIRVLLSR